MTVAGPGWFASYFKSPQQQIDKHSRMGCEQAPFSQHRPVGAPGKELAGWNDFQPFVAVNPDAAIEPQSSSAPAETPPYSRTRIERLGNALNAHRFAALLVNFEQHALEQHPPLGHFKFLWPVG